MAFAISVLTAITSTIIKLIGTVRTDRGML